jgi:hypothetical protein
MQTSRLIGKGFSFLLVLVLFFLWNVAPLFSQQKSTPSTTQAKLKLKSESKALQWSLFSTLIPVITGVTMLAVDKPTPGLTLISTGVILGPSAGYFYAGESIRGLIGIGIRSGLGLIVVASISANKDIDLGDMGLGKFIPSVMGSVVLLVCSVYDIGKVESWVRKHNDQLLKTGLIFLPKYFAQSKALGIELKFIF